MYSIRLPRRRLFLPQFLENLSAADGRPKISLDFSDVRFYTPGMLVGIVAKVHWWMRNGSSVQFENHPSCEAFQYLQRIDFFTQCGIKIDESFARHDPSGRFVPITRIGGRGGALPNNVSRDVATCLAPTGCDSDDSDESGDFDCIEYAVSELALNVQQHARSQGFVSAQFFPRTGMTSIAIGDFGIGIAKSFSESGSPHWIEGMTDSDALELAVRGKVSSKTHLATGWGGPVNAGVGLTILRQLAIETKGLFIIVSGDGAASHTTAFPDRRPRFSGTICEMEYSRSKVKDFDSISAIEFLNREVAPVIDAAETLVFDFAKVRRMNSSFCNALISGVVAHSADAQRKLRFANCRPGLDVLIRFAIQLGISRRTQENSVAIL